MHGHLILKELFNQCNSLSVDKGDSNSTPDRFVVVLQLNISFEPSTLPHRRDWARILSLCTVHWGTHRQTFSVLEKSRSISVHCLSECIAMKPGDTCSGEIPWTLRDKSCCEILSTSTSGLTSWGMISHNWVIGSLCCGEESCEKGFSSGLSSVQIKQKPCNEASRDYYN